MSTLNTHLEQQAPEVLNELNNFRIAEVLCDVKLKVEGKELAAHKNILAAVSPLFKVVFTSPYAAQGNVCIELQNLEIKAMQVILDFAYKRELKITQSNAASVLEAAYFLQVSYITANCLKVLHSSMKIRNCIGIYRLFKRYANGPQQKTVKEYILTNFVRVSRCDEFKRMYVEELVDIIKDVSLPVNSDNQVFEAVLRWFLYRVKERTIHLDKVLSCVRLEQVSPALLNHHLQYVGALQKSSVFLNVVNGIRAKAVQEQPKQLLDYPVEVLVLHASASITPSRDYKEVCITETGNVVKEVIKKTAFAWNKVMSYGEEIGGVIEGALATYDRTSCTWKTSPEMNWPDSCGLTFVDNHFYVIGGYSEDHSHSTDEVYRWNMATKTREALSPLIDGVVNPAVVHLDGKIYVFGGKRVESPDGDFGFDDDDFFIPPTETSSTTLQVYDITTDEWQDYNINVPKFPESHGHGSCAFGRKIFLFLRRYMPCESLLHFAPWALKRSKPGTEPQVHMFDPSTNQWEPCGDLFHLYQSGPVVFKNVMYALTEEKEKPAQSLRPRRYLERFSETTKTWQVFMAFPGYDVTNIFGPLVVRCTETDGEPNDAEKEAKL